MFVGTTQQETTIFTANDRVILSYLQQGGSADLAQLTAGTGLARSSVHSSLQRLIDYGVVSDEHPKSKTVYQIAARDSLERAMQNIVDDLRSLVFPTRAATDKTKLSFTDSYVLPDVQLERLRSRYDISMFPHSHEYESNDLFVERSMGADVIVRFDTQPIDRAFLQRVETLKAVVFPLLCITNVDYEACNEFGVQLFSPDPATHKYYATSQVEYVLNAVLTLLKPLSRFRYQLESIHNYYDWLSNLDEDLFGKKVGVIFERGNIRTIVQMLQLFGCNVQVANTASNPPLTSEIGLSRYDTVEDVWQNSDIVVILEGVHVDVESLLSLEAGPDYLVVGSGLARYSPEAIREQVLSGRLRGLAIDLLPHAWNADASPEVFANTVRMLSDLPNTYITSEVEIFSHESIARSYARVFDILMGLDLEKLATTRVTPGLWLETANS